MTTNIARTSCEKYVHNKNFYLTILELTNKKYKKVNVDEIFYMRLKDKKIIITAAAQGIGKATALAFEK